MGILHAAAPDVWNGSYFFLLSVYDGLQRKMSPLTPFQLPRNRIGVTCGAGSLFGREHEGKTFQWMTGPGAGHARKRTSGDRAVPE
ncbi:hypothetical protein FKM82_029833 [Ascaphus truei]